MILTRFQIQIKIKFTSGYVYILASSVLTQKSIKQTIIVKLTMESEFIAMEQVCNQAKWLKNFLSNLLGLKAI